MQLDAQQLADGINIQARADDAKSADDAGSTRADIRLAGHVVKVDPVSPVPCHDALGTQYDAVFALVAQLVQLLGKRLRIEFCGGFRTCADKYVMGVMVM